MCGRFALYSEPGALQERFGLVEMTGYRPSYNIPPTEAIAAITQEQAGRSLSLYRWGLVPAWVKAIGSRFSTFNARVETIETSRAYRGPFKYHRCLIPADGYYEWQKVGKLKQPWYIHAADKKPMAFAGLFDVWLSPTGDELHSATIITTEAAAATRHIHDRMPAILPSTAWDGWLDAEADKGVLNALLRSTPDVDLATYPVSTRVNKATYDRADCIEANADWIGVK